MSTITYIGMDVHTTNYTLCCYTIEEDKAFAVVQVEPRYTEILKYRVTQGTVLCVFRVQGDTGDYR